MAEVLQRRSLAIAVITDELLVRGLVTAVSWLGVQQLQAFPWKLDAALDYLDPASGRGSSRVSTRSGGRRAPPTLARADRVAAGWRAIQTWLLGLPGRSPHVATSMHSKNACFLIVFVASLSLACDPATLRFSSETTIIGNPPAPLQTEETEANSQADATQENAPASEVADSHDGSGSSESPRRVAQARKRVPRPPPLLSRQQTRALKDAIEHLRREARGLPTTEPDEETRKFILLGHAMAWAARIVSNLDDASREEWHRAMIGCGISTLTGAALTVVSAPLKPGAMNDDALDVMRRAATEADELTRAGAALTALYSVVGSEAASWAVDRQSASLGSMLGGAAISLLVAPIPPPTCWAVEFGLCTVTTVGKVF